MKKYLMLIAALLVSTSAFADGRSAARRFFANLERNHLKLGNASASNTFVAPTLVKGMYAISDQNGKFVTFINEAGTLYGAGSGFDGTFPSQPGFRPLTVHERDALRREIADSIDKSKLITARYGDGQKEKFFVFSAIDCPYCKRLEDRMRDAKAVSMTHYYIPSSLRGNKTQEGRQQWQKVAAIWCAADPERAWHAYWSGTAVPPPAGTCPFADPEMAESAQAYLWYMLKSAGVTLTGTPAYLQMDGRNFRDVPGTSINLEPAQSAYWLVGAPVELPMDFRPQPVGR
ncbi:MAG: thioredoxin fold domain-containing protein [Burkholderiaceae bacterium]|jgi:thiol:disulfide interchange protein DsbC|nr:thioredoxin fold domain-containing protein [Burkholderiaceae bacterium]